MGKILKHSVLENVPFWILAGISIVIGVIAFFLPPMAEIHPSVLRFISWLFAFAALWTVFVAMVRGLDARVTHGKTSLTVGNLDGGEQPVEEKEDFDEQDNEQEI